MLRGLTVGAVALAPFAVHRVKADDCCGKVKVKDLPVYREPDPPQLIYTPEKISAYREKVSVVRQAVAGYYGTVSGVAEKVKDTMEVGKAHTMEVFYYFREDAGAIPKATFVTLSGLAGLIIGYKGRPGAPIRTALLTTTLVVGASYVCYPDPVTKAAAVGWGRVKEQYTSLRTPSEPKAPSPKAPVSEAKDVVTTTTGGDNVKVTEADKDYGMSKAEDKDMYSTRKS